MSNNSFHDNNHIPTLIVIQTDGKTLINIKADPTTHRLQISDGSTGSDNGPSNSFHDANNIASLFVTSSSDGKTPVAAYANASGELLVQST